MTNILEIQEEIIKLNQVKSTRRLCEKENWGCGISKSRNIEVS